MALIKVRYGRCVNEGALGKVRYGWCAITWSVVKQVVEVEKKVPWKLLCVEYLQSFSFWVG